MLTFCSSGYNDISGDPWSTVSPHSRHLHSRYQTSQVHSVGALKVNPTAPQYDQSILYLSNLFWILSKKNIVRNLHNTVNMEWVSTFYHQDDSLATI